MTDKKQTVDFEKSLTKLNALVESLEQGNLTLDDSLKKYEQGIQLTRQCQEALQTAEQRVQILAAQNTLTEFGESTHDSE